MLSRPAYLYRSTLGFARLLYVKIQICSLLIQTVQQLFATAGATAGQTASTLHTSHSFHPHCQEVAAG